MSEKFNDFMGHCSRNLEFRNGILPAFATMFTLIVLTITVAISVYFLVTVFWFIIVPVLLIGSPAYIFLNYRKVRKNENAN